MMIALKGVLKNTIFDKILFTAMYKFYAFVFTLWAQKGCTIFLFSILSS